MLKRWLEGKPAWLRLLLPVAVGAAVFAVLISAWDMLSEDTSFGEALKGNAFFVLLWAVFMYVWSLVRGRRTDDARPTEM